MSELKPCRDAFEMWYFEGYLPDNARNGDTYNLMQAHTSWEAWKEAWNARPLEQALQAKLQIAQEALERVSCPDQTDGLLWWQEIVREALQKLKEE